MRGSFTVKSCALCHGHDLHCQCMNPGHQYYHIPFEIEQENVCQILVNICSQLIHEKMIQTMRPAILQRMQDLNERFLLV